MNKKIERNYLEINSLKDLNESFTSTKEYFVTHLNPPDYQINKFLYKMLEKSITGLIV